MLTAFQGLRDNNANPIQELRMYALLTGFKAFLASFNVDLYFEVLQKQIEMTVTYTNLSFQSLQKTLFGTLFFLLL